MSLVATDDSYAPQDSLSAMDEQQFARWAALLRERAGLHMPAERRSFLAKGLGQRMRELGYAELDAYYELVLSGRAGRLEWTALVDRLTVHETRFFRDPLALEVVQEHCLPTLRERVGRGESVQAWSAGCASGEEVYTLAMLIDRDLAAAALPARFGVVGTDLSLPALATGREAVYPARRLPLIDFELRRRYCERLPDGRFNIVERLRRRVCFAQFNLLEAGARPAGAMDLIYCQNVLIYFERATRAAVLERLLQSLRVGGILVLGAGEAHGWKHPALERIGGNSVLAFRRVRD